MKKKKLRIIWSEEIKNMFHFRLTQMKESFEIEKTTKVQEEELTELENNYKLLKNTF